MNPTAAGDLPKIGYLYHYPRLDHPTDTFQLDIFLSAEPSEKHFDVLRVILPVLSSGDSSEQLKITHPWAGEENLQTCMGVIRMEDRLGKKEEAFSFGGELKITPGGKFTTCTLLSPAPILEISGAAPTAALLVDELEILLAEHKAAHRDASAFEANLCTSSPLELYQACIFDLIQKFEGFSHKTEEIQALLARLHSQAYRLKAAGLLLKPVLTLQELLGTAD